MRSFREKYNDEEILKQLKNHIGKIQEYRLKALMQIKEHVQFLRFLLDLAVGRMVLKEQD